MKKTILITTLALSFVGCIGVEETKEEPVKTLVQINGPQVKSPVFRSVNWWQEMRDSNLRELIKEVLKNNADFKVAQLNIQKAAATLASSRHANLSSFDISGSGAKTRLLKTYADTDLPVKDVEMSKDAMLGMIGMKAEYTLDLWGKYKALTKQAEYTKLGTEMQKNWIASNVSASVAELYGKYILASQQEKIIAEKMDIASKTASFQQTLYNTGLADKANLLEAQIERNNAEKALKSIRNNKETIKNSILALNGTIRSDYITTLLRNAENSNVNLADGLRVPNYIDSDLIVNRPDIRYYLTLINAQREFLKSVKADFYPRFSIVGQVQYQALDVDSLVNANSTMLGIGPSLYLPLFNRSQLKSKYKIAGIDLNRFITEYNSNLIKAYLDVNNSLNALKVAKNNLNLEKKSYNNAKENLENNRLLKKIGRTSEYNYLMSKNDYLDDETNMIQADYDLYINYVNLMKSLGGYYNEEVK